MHRALLPLEPDAPLRAAAAPKLEEHQHKFLIPTLHFQLGPETVKKGLAEAVHRLGVPRRDERSRGGCGLRRAARISERLIAAGRHALETLRQTGEPGVVLVGRSYKIYDRNINCDIRGSCATATAPT